MRQIYQKQGLYTPYIRKQILELIRRNRQSFPKIFAKPKGG